MIVFIRLASFLIEKPQYAHKFIGMSLACYNVMGRFIEVMVISILESMLDSHVELE